MIMDELRDEIERDPELKRLFLKEWERMQQSQRERLAQMERARRLQRLMERDGD